MSAFILGLILSISGSAAQSATPAFCCDCCGTSCACCTGAACTCASCTCGSGCCTVCVPKSCCGK